jgi:hypothetical protein
MGCFYRLATREFSSPDGSGWILHREKRDSEVVDEEVRSSGVDNIQAFASCTFLPPIHESALSWPPSLSAANPCELAAYMPPASFARKGLWI